MAEPQATDIIQMLQTKISVCNETLSQLLSANIELRTTASLLEAQGVAANKQLLEAQAQLDVKTKEIERLNRVVLALDNKLGANVSNIESLKVEETDAA